MSSHSRRSGSAGRVRHSRTYGRIAALLLIPWLLTGCQGFHSSLDPAGPMSGQIYHVIRIFFWVSAVVYLLVVIASILAVMKMRSRVDLSSDPIFMPRPEFCLV